LPKAVEAIEAAKASTTDDVDPMTAAQLLIRWKSRDLARKKVVAFYSDKPSAGPLHVFSNFSEHAPWEFTIPQCCGFAALARSGRPTTVALTFAEKGIMLCKAGAMGDFDMYDEILMATSPASAKKMGRGVSPWDQVRGYPSAPLASFHVPFSGSNPHTHHPQELWDRIVCTVAKTVVLSKFVSDAELRRVLLATGHQLIAEAAKNDRNWGIGLDMKQPEVALPSQWRGANMLGWALMKARTTLRTAAVAP